MKKFLLIAFALLLTSCNRDVTNQQQVWTLSSGLSIIEATSCKSPEKSRLEIQKQAKNIVLYVSIPIPCDTDVLLPYLTLNTAGRATLVFSHKYKSSCECIKEVSLQIRDRLNVGDTLYISSNGEVMGHAVIP